MFARGVHITLTNCDITAEAAVHDALHALTSPSLPPIKGILHTGVTFSDTSFDKLTHAQWTVGLSAKVTGTKNLHTVSLRYQLALDLFVMTSSYEAVVALPTQAAYCAANNFQDAFARYHRPVRPPACALAFGLITDIGVGQQDVVSKMIAGNGLHGIGESRFLRLLEAAFWEQPETTTSWAHFDPLAAAQITTRLDPSKLAKEARKRQDAQMPPWRSDRKFAHINRANYTSSVVPASPRFVKSPL